MKTPANFRTYFAALMVATLVVFVNTAAFAEPATVLFEDQFNQGIPGWTAVHSSVGNFVDAPVLWQYDVDKQALGDNSNAYTDSATYSWSRIVDLLINDTVVSASNFTFKARILARDDDGCGLIWGYQNEGTYYRATFGRQNRVQWPYTGWNVDRMENNEFTDLFGMGTPGHVGTFTNAQPRWFEVTIGMTNGLFSLTVVDDPAGAATVYNLVSNRVLPAYAPGKVGVFTWGMSAATAPYLGVRYENLELNPSPLAGMTNPLTATWTSLVTPRGDGTSNVDKPPMWYTCLNAGGAAGILREGGDSYAGIDNFGSGATNFAAPSLVAGDVNWTNYVYSARFIAKDDDGFGMLLRYQNETNWYRIALRPQNSASGPRKGISIQQCVNGVFDQIMSDGTTYTPPQNVPIELHAGINGNRLQLMVINNPGTPTATIYSYGPYDLTGDILETGKIGLFSWGMFWLDTDYARVSSVAGQGLLVSSAYGSPEPPVGLNDFPSGTTVTASVASVVTDAPGVRRILLGWAGAGSVPSSGTGNTVTFALNGLSSLNWKWQPEYLLTTSAGPGGSVSASLGPWVPAGSNVTVTATASPGYMFTGWTGDELTIIANLTFTLNRPVVLTANFTPDSDSDSLADSWELQYFGNLARNGAGDADTDGVSDLNEFQLGTNPNSAESLLVSDGLSSRWVNPQRDPILPGLFRVVDFGSGYRGAFEDSNDNRNGNDYSFIAPANYADYASFQGPLIVVNSNLWDEAWSTNSSASMEFTIGDDDGSCFYFRYKDEQNWYRVTLYGQMDFNVVRPYPGVSIQGRVNGNFIQLATGYRIVNPDPFNLIGPKKMRVTVNAVNENFEVHVVPWNVNLTPPDFDPSLGEEVLYFSDVSHATGRIGFGAWGQGTLNGANDLPGLPVPSGVFVDNVLVSVAGATVFSETWETARLVTDFPAGWENPYAGLGVNSAEGDWRVSAHGTIMQQANFGPLTSTTAFTSKADADGPVLLAPATGTANYVLQIGIQPFDNDGIGFVYNFYDTNNFSRVLFSSEGTSAGHVPRGLSVSRKADGLWTDIMTGEASPPFVYVPGRQYGIEFANNNGQCHLLVRNLDNPTFVSNWQWTDTATGANRFGLTTWSQTDAHFLYARALSLPATGPFEITAINVVGSNVVLDISKPAGSRYDVLRATSPGGTFVPVATNQSGAQYSEPLPVGGAHFYRLQLAP